MAQQHDVSSLLKAVMVAIRTDPALQARLGLPTTMTEEQRKSYAQGQVMKILTGDYTPFDYVYQPMRTQVVAAMGGEATPAAREAYLTQIMAGVKSTLEESTAVNTVVGQQSKEDGDVIGATVRSVAPFLNSVIALFLDHDEAASSLKFSAKLKITVEDFVGGWVNAVLPQLEQGMTGVHVLIQAVTGEAVQRFVGKYPEYAMMGMLGGPMLTAHFLQSHQAYVVRNPK